MPAGFFAVVLLFVAFDPEAEVEVPVEEEVVEEVTEEVFLVLVEVVEVGLGLVVFDALPPLLVFAVFFLAVFLLVLLLEALLRVVFFATYLSQGKHKLTYKLRCETPGVFNVLPSRAEAMYAPTVRAISDSDRMAVVERK